MQKMLTLLLALISLAPLRADNYTSETEGDWHASATWGHVEDADKLCDSTHNDHVLCSHPDFAALLALYNATDGANWTNNSGWADGAAGNNCDVCSWHGVTCDGDGRVSQIYLNTNNLTGMLPLELGNLSELTYLTFEANPLTGTLPASLGMLSKLNYLQIVGSQISGSIPSELGNLGDLITLQLSENQLSGTIPASLGNLTNLTYLDLSSNQISGSIPASLGNLSNLGEMRLDHNQLTNGIPPEFGNLTNLTHLLLENNQLTGSIPTAFSSMSSLSDLYINDNQLSGAIPVLSSLYTLVASNNQFSGNIPAGLGDMSNLLYLYLDNNNLNGCFPSNLSSLCGIFYDFSNNPGLHLNGDFAAFCNNGAGGCGVDADGDTHSFPNDCDDTNPDLHPGATELCNGIDDDCDGNIDEGAEAPAQIGGTLSFCGSGNTVLTASGGSIFNWSTGATTASITVSTAGTYTVTVDNGNGCPGTATATVAQLALPTPGIGGNLTFCTGGSTALTATGGVSYTWSTGANTASATVNAAGTYTVTATGSNGCTASTTATVAQLPLPTPGIGGNLTFCAGGSTALNASGGVSYTWNTGANTASATVNAAGTYTVTATGANGCTASTTATVAQLALPTPGIGGNLTFCAGGSTALTATGGVSYTWSTSANTVSITVNAAGTYTVTATGANGCTASTTATVAQLPLPTPGIGGNLTFCAGGSTALTATGGVSYTWSTGAATASINVSAAGTYTVTATGANGCTATATAAVTQLPSPAPSISNTSSGCVGGNSMLTASGGTAYVWSTGATTATITVNTAATYTVTATGANGCTASATTIVTSNAPSAQITGNTTICPGGTATLTATGGASYTWSTGATTTSINTNVADSYTVTATAANGCTATATATVSVNYTPLFASVLGNLAFCEGSSTTLTPSAGGTSYAWSTGASTASININIAGTFTVTITNVFSSGCSATATANTVLKPRPNPGITAIPNNCAGLGTTLTATGGTSYVWNTGASSNTIVGSAPGFYSVTATNASNCTNVAFISLQARPSPACTNQTICASTSTTLFSTPTGGTYSGPGVSGNNFNAAAAGLGTHIITYTVTGAGGCTASCTFTMTVVPGPDANIAAASPVAANSTGNSASVANAGAGATYAWTIANGTITSGNGTNTIAYTAGASGSVALSVSVGAGGCTASANRSISIGNGPSMICPSGQTVGTDLNACSANLSLAHPAVTGSNPPLTLSVAFGNGSPAPSSLPTGGAVTPGGTTNYVFQSGQTQVTYTATNGLGQTATCIMNIAVRDQQAPILTCPLNIVRGTDAGQCAAMVSYATPSATDNCGAASASLLSGLNSGVFFPIGTTTVVWRVKDVAGNLATCAFSVTVQDNQLPNITCPPNQNLSTHPSRCETYALYNAPTASDNCGTPSLNRTSGPESGGPFPKGLNTIVWQARDAAGNTRTCSFRVIVSDNEAPTIFCPENISVNTDFGTCSAIAYYATANFFDNCPGGTIARIGGLPSGSSFPVGVTPVSFRATDASGRSSTCTLRVTVTDNQPPSMACPGNIVVTGSGTPCNAQVFYGTPSATDNCSGTLTPFLFAGLGSGSSFPAGVTTNVWRAIDGNGLSTDCTFTVTVNCTNTAPRPNGQTARETLAQQQPTLHLAPNPATSSTTLTAEGLGEQGGDILVFDAMGRLVFQHPVLPADATIRLDFGAAAVPPGTYRVALRTEKAVVSKTLVVAK